MMKKKILAFLLTGLIISIAGTGCSVDSNEEVPVEKETINIITTTFPVYDITRQIVKDKALVEMLNYEYVEEYQYSGKDINKLNNADIIIYSGNSFEPWVEEALEDENFTNEEVMLVNAALDISSDGKIANYIDIAGELKLNENFPQTDNYITSDFAYWMDLNNAKKMVNTIQKHISNYDYENDSFYKESAENLLTSFTNLDERYKVLTNKTDKSMVVVGSFNYYYLAQYLKLNIISVYDGRVNEETTASLKRLLNAVDFINNNNIKYVISDNKCKYAEEAISTDVKVNALNINDMSHVDKSTIDDEEMTYYNIMENNYAVLKMCLY